MKLIFDHAVGFGKMRDQVIFYSPVGALVEPSEQLFALENGWFPVNDVLWFQSRSTRINLGEYETHKSILDLAAQVKFYPDVNMTPEKRERLKEIYSKYIAYKGFKRNDYSIDDILVNSHGHIYYTYQNKIIAFMFFKIIKNNFLAIEFGWDYENPKLSLGKVNIHYASVLAKFKKCKYIYMSAGYESSSAYKANYKGFEWWTGMKWSKDVDKYKELCYSDDQVILINHKYS